MLDREQIIPKIKKYVLYISIVFFFSSFIHLAYLYLFSNSKNIALNGWSLSEAIIGDFPHLNPLVSWSDYNKYIIHALYRSLLRYDSKEKKFVGDITSCDIKNLQFVECFLNDSVKWSDGTDITTKDIISTFSLIKKTQVNPVISSLLSETEVEDKATSVIFRTKKSDINFLNIFLQPIISEKSINSLSEEEVTGKFPIEGMLYSWPYIVDSIWQDENLGIKKLTLSKNKSFPENQFIIDKIVFKVFNDTPHFLKHKDSINIFNDKLSLIGDTLPRLSVFEYTLPQYVSVFINSEKISDISLRKHLLSLIERENIIKLLGEKNFQEVKNPYLSDISIDVPSNEKNVENLLKRSWYFKKEELAKEILSKADTQIKNNLAPKSEIDIQKQANIVFAPSSNMYNFISEDDILLKWKVNDPKIDTIYINDYKLKWFRSGDGEFIYRLKQNWFNTIKEGKNTYKIIFETSWKKEMVDQVVYYFYKDTNLLEAEKKKLTTPLQWVVSTWATLPQENKEKIEAIKKIDLLDGKFLYNKNLEKLSFNLLYADTDKYISDTAKSIQAQLEQAWIGVNLEWVDVNQLNKKLLKWNKDYDFILVWVNLWYFENNIFPYFHSSQVKEGYNFSNFKKLWLDIALEDLKSSNMTQEKIIEGEKKVLNIIKQEAIVKTLYTPIIKQLVDKNIKNYSIPGKLMDDTLRFWGLRDAYILQKRIINYSEKSITGFFVFIWKSLFL